MAGPDLTVDSAAASAVSSDFSISYGAADDWLPAETTWAEACLGACPPLCERKGRQ